VDRASTASTSATAGRSASRFSRPQARREWRHGFVLVRPGGVCCEASAGYFRTSGVEGLACRSQCGSRPIRTPKRFHAEGALNRPSIEATSSRQFGLDALLTPKAILGGHACDQSSKLYRDRWAATSFFVRGSPPPVCPPTHSLPAQNCFRFHNQQRMPPVAETIALPGSKGADRRRSSEAVDSAAAARPTAAADKGSPR
jgi:hypothetical protein